MKKALVFLLIVIIATILGGIYGILHDQITYSISPEYYTKFKFHQFGLDHTAIFQNERQKVAVVGFMATWWMGTLIGMLLGLLGLVHRNSNAMLRVTFNAFFVTIFIAFITGVIGLAYGYFFLAAQPKENFNHWHIPDNLVDFKHFIMVGSMHNFSYLGGLLGLAVGIAYSIKMKRKEQLDIRL